MDDDWHNQKNKLKGKRNEYILVTKTLVQDCYAKKL